MESQLKSWWGTIPSKLPDFGRRNLTSEILELPLFKALKFNLVTLSSPNTLWSYTKESLPRSTVDIRQREASISAIETYYKDEAEAAKATAYYNSFTPEKLRRKFDVGYDCNQL